MFRKTIVIKPTLECNLQCRYCYEFARADRRVLASDGLLTSEAVTLIIRRFAKVFPGSEILWLFHGGEPLLFGKGQFEKVLKCIQVINETSNCNFKFALQTNGTLLNKEFIALFVEYAHLLAERQISISIDGPTPINDSARWWRNQKFSQAVSEKIFEVSHLLRESKISLNTITVVGQHNVCNADKLFDFFNEFGSKYQKYIPCYNVTADGKFDRLGISPIGYSNFLCQLFDLWKVTPRNPKTGDWVFIDPLTSIIGNITSGKCVSRWCEYSDDKCDNFITIFPNGELRICESYTDERYKDIVSIGNIYDVSDEELTTLLSNPDMFSKFKIFKDNLMGKCSECEVLEICKGGCLHYRDKLESLSENLREMYCVGKKLLINHIKDGLREVI